MAKKSSVVDLDNDFTEVDDAVVMVEETDLKVAVESPLCPPKSSLERTKFILGHLDESEQFAGNPKVAGLRRLVEKFVGEIIEARTTINFVDIEHSAAVTTHSIRVKTFSGEVVGPFDGTADSSLFNNNDPKFAIYPTCCSETRSKGRAYVSALGINAVSSEEIMRGDQGIAQVSEPKITDAQMNAVEVICKSADMNTNQVLWKYAQEYGHSRIGEMTKSEGASVIKAINVYQQGTPVPSNLQGFKPLKKS